MKNLTPLLICLSIVFASCSSNESEISNETPKKDLLKSYSLKRDASGAYSIDFNVDTNTDVATFKNNNNSNDIILSKSNNNTKTSYTNAFAIENDQLKIGFINAEDNNKTSIYVVDDNITNLAKKGVTEFLSSYSVTANNDGTYQLDFVVNNNVKTEFTYNEELKTYEVNLSSGSAKQKEFSRTFELTNDVLKINFVNHKNTSARGGTDPIEISKERKPRIIINHGDYA